MAESSSDRGGSSDGNAGIDWDYRRAGDRHDILWGHAVRPDITNPALANNRPRGDYVKQLADAIESQLLWPAVNPEPEPWMLHTKPASTCVVGVRIKGTGAWGDPPACAFQ
jgi:hypothetical protein